MDNGVTVEVVKWWKVYVQRPGEAWGRLVCHVHETLTDIKEALPEYLMRVDWEDTLGGAVVIFAKKGKR
jgi:hypothetical protein